jgi:chromosome partitioning protein
MPAVKTYAVINQKGGVGKTTTVANLGAVIASRGIETCLVDLDPQAHLTLHFGIEPGSADLSAYDILTDGAGFCEAAVKVAPRLSVVPSVIDLAAAEVELVTKVGREQILRESLAAASDRFELVMIDCPPSLGLLTLNSLAAADEVLIPLQPHFLALQGLGKLLETIALVRQRINHRLSVAGVVFCMYETGTRLAGEVVGDLQGFLDAARGADLPWSRAKVFQRRIRRNIKLAECPSHGKTIFDYDPASIGAEDYHALADEFLAAAFPARSAEARAEESPTGDRAKLGETDQAGDEAPPTDDDEATGDAQVGDDVPAAEEVQCDPAAQESPGDEALRDSLPAPDQASPRAADDAPASPGDAEERPAAVTDNVAREEAAPGPADERPCGCKQVAQRPGDDATPVPGEYAPTDDASEPEQRRCDHAGPSRFSVHP